MSRKRKDWHERVNYTEKRANYITLHCSLTFPFPFPCPTQKWHSTVVLSTNLISLPSSMIASSSTDSDNQTLLVLWLAHHRLGAKGGKGGGWELHLSNEGWSSSSRINLHDNWGKFSLLPLHISLFLLYLWVISLSPVSFRLLFLRPSIISFFIFLLIFRYLSTPLFKLKHLHALWIIKLEMNLTTLETCSTSNIKKKQNWANFVAQKDQ